MPHPPIRCFLLEPTARRRRWLLRRSFRGERCRTRNTQHRARVPIEDEDYPLRASPPPEPEWIRHRADPRWPDRCEFCDYRFGDDDERKLLFGRIYRDPEGNERTLDEAPPGAMWDAWWKGPEFRGRDGFHLAAMTPGGVWYVDGRSPLTGLHWARVGTPPDVTVKPSNVILGRYHGVLEDGYLIEV